MAPWGLSGSGHGADGECTGPTGWSVNAHPPTVRAEAGRSGSESVRRCAQQQPHQHLIRLRNQGEFPLIGIR